MQDRTLLIVNGPGLGELAENDQHGAATIEGLESECAACCLQHELELDFRQTDDVAEMAGWLAAGGADFAGVIINPAGCAQSEKTNLDDLGAAITRVTDSGKPVVEVHWANIFQEGAGEAQPLKVPGADLAFVCGLGPNGYQFAISAIATRLAG